MPPVGIGSPEDTDGCLIVCQVLQSMPALAHKLPGYYEPLASQHVVFTPLPDDQNWSTSYMLQVAEPTTSVQQYHNGRKHLFSHNWYNQTVAETRTTEKYVPVAVAGPAYIMVPATSLPYTGGARDCYVEWLPLEGGDFPPGAVLLENGSKRVYQIKRAAGCVLTRTRAFDAQGQAAGYVTTAVVIEASWYLGPPDNLKVDVYGHTYCHNDESEDILPPNFFYKGRPALADALQRAQAGFRAHCSSWPDYAEAARISFNASLEEAPKTEAEFAALTQGMDWVEAFGLIGDAMQLAAAAKVLRPAEFAHRQTPNKRGRAMVERYAQLRPDRAEEINALWVEAKQILLLQQ